MVSLKELVLYLRQLFSLVNLVSYYFPSLVYVIVHESEMDMCIGDGSIIVVLLLN